MGARAIVQKRFAFETLIEAVRTAAHGLVWLPRHYCKRNLQRNWSRLKPSS